MPRTERTAATQHGLNENTNGTHIYKCAITHIGMRHAVFVLARAIVVAPTARVHVEHELWIVSDALSAKTARARERDGARRDQLNQPYECMYIGFSAFACVR